MGIAACLSPLGYIVVQALNQYLPCELLTYLANKPFGQYFDRFRLLGILCVIPLSLRFFKITWHELRCQFSRETCKIGLQFFIGGLCLWGMSACLLYVQPAVQLSQREVCPSLLMALCSSLVASLTIAFLEEITFRGLLFRIVRKVTGSKFCGVHLVSFIFACLHFSHITEPEEGPLFWQGLQCAFHSTLGIFYQIRWAYFCILYVLSYLLCLCVLSKKTLLSSIGLHGGLVCAIMCFRRYYVAIGSSHEFMNVTDAWSTFFLLLIIAICARWKCKAVI